MKQAEVRRYENHADWAISSEALNRGTFNDYPGCGSRSKRSEIGGPKPHKWHGEDIVCASVKAEGVPDGTGQAANLVRTARNDNISIYYEVGNGLHPGAIITHYDKRFLILNEESIENRVYHRSDGINSDIMISTYDKTTGEEINLPAFGYDLTGETPHKSDIMTTIAGNVELMSGDCEMSRKLKVNMEFFAMGNYYRIVAVSFKTGICRITAQVILSLSDPTVYDLTINTMDTYTQGDAVKLTASATVDNGPIANPTLTWSSSDPSIITLTEDGNALFVGAGTCAISCYWKEHDITETVFVNVVEVPVSLECEITGSDTIYESTSATEYKAAFYQADGKTEDTTIIPVWSLDVPSAIANRVQIAAQSGNTVTVKVLSNTRGNSFGLELTDAEGKYHATKTIKIVSWF